MNAGLATVLPDNPSVCASIIDNETGLVYKDTDLSSATEALCKLVDDDGLRKRLGSNAERTIQSDYNLADTNKEFINIIKKSNLRHAMAAEIMQWSLYNCFYFNCSSTCARAVTVTYYSAIVPFL